MKTRIMWLVAACLVLAINSAWAQGDATSKITGDAYHFYSGQTYDAHAYDWARILNQYSTTRPLVPIEDIQENVKSIRRNVEAAQKAYSKLSEATKKNPETAKKLAEIEKQHSKILELCATLEAKEGKTGADSSAICAHCKGIKEHLTAAHSASREAATSADTVTDELEQELGKPGRGIFSD